MSIFGLGIEPAGIANPSRGLSSVTTRVANCQDWRRMNRSFEELKAYFAFFDPDTYNMTGVGGEPERLAGADVAQNFLAFAGVRTAHGHGLSDRPSTRNDRATTVVGVLPAAHLLSQLAWLPVS